jgi:hypothetical protein
VCHKEHVLIVVHVELLWEDRLAGQPALKLDAPLARLENTKPRLALVRASTVMQESSRP